MHNSDNSRLMEKENSFSSEIGEDFAASDLSITYDPSSLCAHNDAFNSDQFSDFCCIDVNNNNIDRKKVPLNIIQVEVSLYNFLCFFSFFVVRNTNC